MSPFLTKPLKWLRNKLSNSKEDATISTIVTNTTDLTASNIDGHSETFTMFPELATEIRLAIWALAAIQPRNVIVEWRKREKGDKFCNQSKTLTPVPSLLHINWEARHVGLRKYIKFLTENPDSDDSHHRDVAGYNFVDSVHDLEQEAECFPKCMDILTTHQKVKQCRGFGGSFCAYTPFRDVPIGSVIFKEVLD